MDLEQTIAAAQLDTISAAHVRDAVQGADFLFPGEESQLVWSIVAVLTAENRPIGDVPTIVAMLRRAVDSGVCTFQDIARFVVNVAPLAGELGQPVEALLAMVAHLTTMGMAASSVEEMVTGSLFVLKAWREADV